MHNTKTNRPKQNKVKKYVDSCVSYEVLLQDSGFLPKPTPTWNTFIPQEGDYAKVGESDEYQFTEGHWVKHNQ